MATNPEIQAARPGRRNTGLQVIGTLIALVLLVYLLSQQGWSEIWGALRKISPWQVGFALLLMVLSRLAIIGRWHVLLRSSRVPISLGQSTRITFAGLFATNFLPTTIGGDVIRLAAAMQLHFSGTVCAASLIVDRLVGMAGMAMALPLGLPSFLQSPVLSQPLAGFYGLTSSALALASGGSRLQTWWQKGQGVARRLWAALVVWRKRPQALFFSMVFSWLNMLCLFGVLTVVLQGMHENIDFWLVSGLYSIVYFLSLVPISINSYGLQEVSMTFIFSQVGGVSLASALVTALLFRTLMIVVSLVGAAFVPGIMAGMERR